MAGENIGEILLNLVVNRNDFERQMGGIQKLAVKVGKTLAAAFAVNKLVAFGKECLEVGSDLAEVQNVVDVTFPAMAAQVDAFAKGAANAFGLSETMAKQFTGTFGAMAKAFGFSEKQAYDMGTALTGLAGDVASFYNLSQDEAYTKLKSVFTGETESLKDLGVVMTQTSLDAFALANGYGKTTSAMSEAEKVALRYAFIQKQLSAAQGDFARTSDSWANQTRILKLQIDSFKAAIGQGLINVLTPAIRAINTLMSKLVQLAGVFKAFTESFAGKKTESVAEGLVSAEAAAAGISDNIDSAGKAAKKLKSLLPTDELTLLNSQDSGDSSASGDAAGLDIPALQTAVEAIDTETDSLLEKIKKIFSGPGIDEFISRFKNGIQKIDFEEIRTNFSRITDQLPGLAETSVKNIETIMRPLGGYIGTRLGNAIAIRAETLNIGLDGLATYLEKNVDQINAWSQEASQAIGSGFTNLTGINEDISNAVLGGLEEAKPVLVQGISDFLSGFTGLGMGVGTILSDSFQIATSQIAQWVSENKELLQSTIADLASFAGETGSLIGQIAGDVESSLSAWWDEKGSKTFEGIISVWNDLKTIALQLWNDVLMPVLNNLKNEVQTLWDSSLKPLWDNVLGFLSSAGDFLTMLWTQILQPIIAYLIDTCGPTVKNVASIIISVAGTVASILADVIGGILKALGGLMDFLTGVFTGDWEKAWTGIKDFVSGIWDAIVGVIKGAINLIIDAINLMVELAYSLLRTVVNGIGDTVGKLGDAVGKNWHFSIPDDPPKIPKLANGGYVKANTPQLAMIGDNRHYGEIVAPEDKLQAMADSAVAAALKAASGNASGKQMETIISLLNIIINLISEGHVIELDGNKLGRTIRQLDYEYYNATGSHLINI